MLPQDLLCQERPTVLHVSQPVDGGVARVVTDLVRAQVAAGLRAVVAAPSGGELHRDAAAAGAEVVPWPARRSLGPALAGETARLARLVRRTGPHLIHTHSAKAGLAARLAVRGRVPTVHQPHAWPFEAAGGTAGRLALDWERYAARWADRVLCASEAERLRGAEAGVPARWAVIRNGVDLDRCAPAYRDDAVRRALRRDLPALGDLPPDGPLVVCVGRLCPQKGQLSLLRAWPAVGAALPDARLVLVGDGPDRELLHAAAPPGVRFAGRARSAVPWYRAADLVVLPSRWEGMALAPLEAMACGRPVVVTDVGGARESLPPGAAPHCLVPPTDPAALAQAVLGLLTRPQLRTTLAHRSLEHMRATYDVRHTAAAVLGLYRELLGAACPESTERISR
ncbi:glycosyltransferase family 4 protein [Streptomyces hygroscopicus]|uniref:glycosyltransferase family 4 protein n=1 Tax=Streptomyces hygroscopicus TaxID=1912 RepID=UPI001FCC3D6B|nr:glycosyltransferase family 4 protein [Streptomyces hygroscopicus]BDH09980.1 glycosyl transferase family 1 [Streptomyces hygroscopicus]